MCSGLIDITGSRICKRMKHIMLCITFSVYIYKQAFNLFFFFGVSNQSNQQNEADMNIGNLENIVTPKEGITLVNVLDGPSNIGREGIENAINSLVL